MSNSSFITLNSASKINRSKASCSSCKKLAVKLSASEQEREALKAALSISNAELAEKSAQIESYKSDLLKAKEEICRLQLLIS